MRLDGEKLHGLMKSLVTSGIWKNFEFSSRGCRRVSSGRENLTDSRSEVVGDSLSSGSRG